MVAKRDVECPHRLFGQWLMTAREKSHMSRPEFAQLSGISYPMMANLEAGRRRASDGVVEKLAYVLDVDIALLRRIRDAAPLATVAQPAETLNDVYSQIIAEAQQAASLIVAAQPQAGEVSLRQRAVVDVVKSLGGLSLQQIGKVQGYIEGLKG